MKSKIVFAATLLFLFVSSKVTAQTEKGTWMLGGSASMALNFSNGTSFGANLNPSGGYFLCNHFALGGSLSAGYNSNNGIRHVNLGFQPVWWSFFGNSEKIKIFFGTGAGINRSMFLNNQFSSSNSTYYNIYFGPGVMYFLNPNVGVKIALDNNYIVYPGEFSNFQTRLGVGFQIFMKCHKGE